MGDAPAAKAAVHASAAIVTSNISCLFSKETSYKGNDSLGKQARL